MSETTHPETVTVTGSCLCEAIRYTATGTPRRLLVCHCSNCRKASGSAFVHNYAFAPGTITFHQGEEHVRTYDDSKTTSGNTLYRHFCGNCGSPVYLTNSAFGGLVVVHIGNVDAESLKDDTPWIEIYEEQRKPWLDRIVKEKQSPQ